MHLTSHRLLYVDLARSRTNSLALSLSFITTSEYYAGFLSSSAKVTIYLKESTFVSPSGENTPRSSSDDVTAVDTDDALAATSWICPVCSYSNPAAVNDDARPKCSLCGVPRDPLAYAASMSTSSRQNAPAVHRSPSMPTLRHPAPIPASEILAPNTDELAESDNSDPNSSPCPACTYLNHRSMRYCEICGTLLPSKLSYSSNQSSKSSGSTPAPVSITLPATSTLRISFRKGGDKQFYNHLRRVMKTKAWNDVSALVDLCEFPLVSLLMNRTPSMMQGEQAMTRGMAQSFA